MYFKHLLFKSLLVIAGLCVGTSTWADDVVVPTPVYFNDFSFARNGEDGIEIVGNGQFEDDADERFGRIFHNDPKLTKAVRTNYLKLPADVLSHSGTSKEMTIGFWVNMKDAVDFFYSPLFTAYNNETKASDSTSPWPIFTCLARKVVSLNCWGYCDLSNTHNDKGTNAETSAWLDDKAWHYYTITLTSTTIKVYIDGIVENSWTVDGTTEGQVINGLFEGGAAYTHENGIKYICLGGNQSNNFNDPDPAFGFDDFTVYNVALSKEQIDQIRANKLRNATGTKVGKQDNSTEYLTATSNKITLKPGESYHYSFINYNNGSTNHNNWTLPVYNTSDVRVITLRADNWEDMHHVGDTWGSNTGCTSDFNWTNFPGNINGATVDMTVTFTKDKVFNMSSTINTVDGSTWHYSYANNYTDSPISLTSDDYIKVALSVSRSWLDITSQGYSAVSKTITSAGWATYCSPYALDLANATGLTDAYIVIGGTGGVLAKTSVKSGTVAANTGLLLKGAEGTATIPVVASGTDYSSTNKLVGVLEDTEIAQNTGYVLMNDATNGLGFYKNANATAFTVGANTAYLPADFAGAGARSFYLFDDELTGIKNIESAAQKAEGDFFDLQGRKVAQPTKGLYIVNGKKVIIK